MSPVWESGYHEWDADYYGAVGFLCHQWNLVEYFAYTLASELLGLDYEYHAILFRHLSIKSIQEFTADHAKRAYPKTIIDQVEYANAYVDRCRINRNLIVHGLPTTDPGTGAFQIRSMADKNRRASRQFPISIEAVRLTCDQCEIASELLFSLRIATMPEGTRLISPAARRGRYAKPPLPKLLVASPHEPQKPSRPR